MSWLLKINGESKNLDMLKAVSAKLKRVSLASDEFVIVSRDISVAQNDDFAEVFFGGERRFCGRLCSKKSLHGAEGERFEFLFKSPWNELKEIPYLQNWSEKVDEIEELQTLGKTRIVLGLNEDGKKINIGTQIQDIIGYARSVGSRLRIGTNSADSEAPADELTDQSCEEAISRTLRWAPDIVSSLDYSDDDATILNLRKRSQLEDISLSSELDFKSINYCVRNDLQMDSVCVIYEKTHTIDGQSWNASERDIYPEGAQTGGRKSLVMTIELGGVRGNVQTQKIVTQEIQTGSSKWWFEKFPFLQNPQISSFTVGNISRETTLPRELVSGTVQEWMLKSAERDVIRGEITYFIDGKKAGVRNCAFKCTATNASTYNYSHNSYTGYDEPIPAGLAKSVYGAVCDSQIEGELEIANAQSLDLLCKKISIEGKFQGAVVVETLLDLFSKNLHVKFGPPKHLYPADIAQIFRIARPRNAPRSATRSSGISPSSGTIDLGGTGAIESCSAEYKNLSRLEISDPEENENTILIDISDIEEEAIQLTAKFRKTLVISDGRPKYAYVLMTEPFEMDG